MAAKSKSRHGLLLNVGGAPNVPHTVAGWPGLYRPDVPTPVGGGDDVLTLEEAKQRLADWAASVKAAQATWEADEKARAEDLNHVRVTPQPFERPEPPLVLVEIDDVEEAEGVRDQDLAIARNAVVEARHEARTKRRRPAGDDEQIENAAKVVAGKESD